MSIPRRPARSLARRALPSLLLLTAVGAFCLTTPAGCFLYKDDPLYCAGFPDNTCPEDELTCSSDAQCTEPGKLVCDTDKTKVCVECTPTSAAACAGKTPVCGDTNACRACSQHTDCLSAVCMPDGSCGDETKVAYVAAAPLGTDNGPCTKAMPCTKLSKALDTALPVVKINGTVDEKVTIDKRSVMLLADPGAKLTSVASTGILLEVKNDIQVDIYDLELTGATGPSGIGISVPPGSAPTLNLHRVQVMGNSSVGIGVGGGKLMLSRSTIASNLGGGISITTATFDITNSFIYRNGTADTTTFGGLRLDIATAPGNRLEFNTITDNRALANSGGVICNVAAFAGANNIIARNSLNSDATAPNAQTFGACTYPTSRVQNDLTGLMFEDPEAPAPFNYRLKAGSPLIDQATTASAIIVDFDGDVRPQGGQKDIGADEVKQ